MTTYAEDAVTTDNISEFKKLKQLKDRLEEVAGNFITRSNDLRTAEPDATRKAEIEAFKDATETTVNAIMAG